MSFLIDLSAQHHRIPSLSAQDFEPWETDERSASAEFEKLVWIARETRRLGREFRRNPEREKDHRWCSAVHRWARNKIKAKLIGWANCGKEH